MINLSIIALFITCVVLPDPVSPDTITTLLVLMALVISSLNVYTGRVSLKFDRSDVDLDGGTCGTPLFSLPVAALENSLVKPEATKINV